MVQKTVFQNQLHLLEFSVPEDLEMEFSVEELEIEFSVQEELEMEFSVQEELEMEFSVQEELEMENYTCSQQYCQVSNIRRTESQNLNVSRLGLQLSLCNILKPSVKWRVKM